MPIQREFLDWRQPALSSAAEWLLRQYGTATTLDLSPVIVVVPAGRAARRLDEMLVAAAAERRLLLTPPEIVTPERLPELLYQPKRQFADALTQELAWLAALRSLPPAELAPFLPVPPDSGDTPRWLAVAQTLRRLHTELAADQLDCQEVLAQAARLDGFAEHARWEVLGKLQRRYLDTLDRLELWDVQTARLVAIRQREIATARRVVLVGTADLNRAQRAMLDQIPDQVTALVVAPPEYADRFDEHGCLQPAAWTMAPLPLDDAQIERVDGPADQAEAVTRWLAALAGRFRADEIAIGLPDARLVPHVQRQLEQAGVASRWAAGRPLAESGPFRLLVAAADYASRRRFRDLAALVRHPDLYAWLQHRLRRYTQSDLLTDLDEYALDRCPARLEEDRLQGPHDGVVRMVYRTIERLLKDWPAQSQPLPAWAGPLRGVLKRIYGARDLDRDNPHDQYVLAALAALRAALDALAALPPALEPHVDARQACRLALAGCAEEGVEPPAAPGAVDLLGWLELPLDDAPALLVTTFNDGYVPSTAGVDAFLPNRVRQSLGLVHNDRRLARDAYALHVLRASRRELKLVVGRRDVEGNPLVPSRLLFAAPPEAMVARARTFFGELRSLSPRRNLLTPSAGPRERTLLDVPRPRKLAEPIDELSVTRFRDYLACPYRFYLRHVLALGALDDDVSELDGAAFGNLVHRVLEEFGRAADAAEVRACTEPERIAEYLDSQLDRLAGGHYGLAQARPAVRVQIEQARLRLRAFAHWQAQRTHAGWQIVFSEDSEARERLEASFPVDERPFTIYGRIDRIDYHAGERKLAVLDYKTADLGDSPDRTHRRGDDWVDLQLPLYRHLVRERPWEQIDWDGESIELGYVLLPRDLSKVGLAAATWEGDELQAADAMAEQVIRAVWNEEFWPPAATPSFADDLAPICQDRRLGAWDPESEGEAA